MKTKLIQALSLLLAGALQILPLARSMLPTVTQGLAPSTWAIIFRWAAGGTAMFGYHAISSASSISISPPTATIGTPYVGTITYSGGHAGSVTSIGLTTNAPYNSFTCLGSMQLAPGLTATYSGGNTLSVSGTPSGSNSSTNHFSVRLWDGNSCSGGNSDTRATDLAILLSGGGNVGATIAIPPQHTTSQVGVNVLLSGAAFGTPAPGYYWTHNGANVPGASTNYLTLPNVQLTDAGFYTLHATNSGNSAAATCYLTVALTPGTNVLALNYTNYYPASTLLTLYSLVTNVPVATNTYAWLQNGAAVGITTSNWSLTAAQVLPTKSGKFAVQFSSIVPTNALIGTNNVIVSGDNYYSYWQYGYPPMITNHPAATNVGSGANAAFTAAVGGSLNTLCYPTNVSPLYYFVTNNNTACVFWYKNQTNLVAAQVYSLSPISPSTYSNQIASVSLTLPNVSAGDAGNYTVVITNYWGSITSSPAQLTVTSSGTAPGITSQPTPQSVLAGQNASFSVTASGTAPLSYQWQKVGLGNLSNGGVYSGVNTNVLSLTGASLANAGNYLVVITNIAGTTNSSTVTLSVSAPPITILTPNGANSAVLSAVTIPGQTYVVETKSDLSGLSWVAIFTNTTPGNGNVLFTNTTINPQQFFRLRFP